ncbi:MAG: alpha/beta fold hydrolase [Betaproteobacteria bacterium]|nr:alpha/beta fold hydrolase [Betaproteobacteria bacterium]
MFEGSTLQVVKAGDVSIRARIGGSGPPLLMLHGNPQTHVMWHKVVPFLYEHFTVVTTDLTGYGMSSKPVSTPGHDHYSKRSMARDQLVVMRELGFRRFAVCGHDRGGRVAYRLALDEPEVVSALAVLDIIPTLDSFETAGRAFGLGYYHWYFLAQPSPLPERLIGSDPEWFWRWHTSRGQSSDVFTDDALEDYLTCFRDPETVRAICEDYRAAATLDVAHDAHDRDAGRRISCPTLVLWGQRGRLQEWYDVPAIWRRWSNSVHATPLPCGHYLAEEAPADTARELVAFLT